MKYDCLQSIMQRNKPWKQKLRLSCSLQLRHSISIKRCRTLNSEHGQHSWNQSNGEWLRRSTDKLMSQEILRWGSFVLVSLETKVKEVGRFFRHAPCDFADWRLLGGNLEDGGNTFELMPRRMSSQHLDHRATEAPANHKGSKLTSDRKEGTAFVVHKLLT